MGAAGAGNATRTNFRFVDGRLRQIEIIACTPSTDCGRTPEMDYTNGMAGGRQRKRRG